MDIAPITDRIKIIDALSEILSVPTAPSTGRVVEFDLQTVCADLSAVPLDEILDFRAQNLVAHQLYMRSLRKFARELSLLPVADQQSALKDRQAELDEYAAALRKLSRSAWRKPATIGLGLAGAAWAVTGDPISALFAVGGIAAGDLGANSKQVDPFSYIMSIREAF